jgi:hypothetical protein
VRRSSRPALARGTTGSRFSSSFERPRDATRTKSGDLDNLIKPTLDAMERVFGLRPGRGPTQAADDRVDHLEASKRTISGAEMPGARIEVRRLLS